MWWIWNHVSKLTPSVLPSHLIYNEPETLQPQQAAFTTHSGKWHLCNLKRLNPVHRRHLLREISFQQKSLGAPQPSLNTGFIVFPFSSLSLYFSCQDEQSKLGKLSFRRLGWETLGIYVTLSAMIEERWDINIIN